MQLVTRHYAEYTLALLMKRYLLSVCYDLVNLGDI
jgi:hypothetical protein